MVPNMGSDPRHDRVNDRQCSPGSIPVSRTTIRAVQNQSSVLRQEFIEDMS